ncbi:MAG: hypothetical protein ACTSSP_00895 [Candidatus Asgardarchaeia archaeon]
MSIVPSGKARVMVAQNYPNPLSGGYGVPSVAEEGAGPRSAGPEQSLETGQAMEEDVTNDVGTGVNDDVSLTPGEEEQLSSKEKGRKTLTSYIFEKLQNYGYPGRRLQEFKTEFVKESVSPEGVKDIEVVLPDKKYPDEKGFTDTIENEELKEIAHEVNQTFGLNFNGADRAGGKWTIKFTSANLVGPEDLEMSRDSLDQVYGRPDKGGQPGGGSSSGGIEEKKPVVRAFTHREMIKEQKDKIVSELKKAIGE